jgi:hypothetical protein
VRRANPAAPASLSQRGLDIHPSAGSDQPSKGTRKLPLRPRFLGSCPAQIPTRAHRLLRSPRPRNSTEDFAQQRTSTRPAIQRPRLITASIGVSASSIQTSNGETLRFIKHLRRCHSRRQLHRQFVGEQCDGVDRSDPSAESSAVGRSGRASGSPPIPRRFSEHRARHPRPSKCD